MGRIAVTFGGVGLAFVAFPSAHAGKVEWGRSAPTAPDDPIIGDPRDNPTCANFYSTDRVPYGGYQTKDEYFREMAPNGVTTNVITRQYLDSVKMNATQPRKAPHWYRMVSGKRFSPPKVLFARVPKSASTTITYSLHPPVSSMDIGGYITAPVLKHLPKKKQKYASTLKAALQNEVYAFTFVREPLARLVSAYYEANNRQFGKYKLLPNDPLYKKRTYLKVKGEPERFRTFVDNLVADDLPLPLFVDTSHETHALGQFDYLNQIDGLRWDFIGYAEHSLEHWELLKEHYQNQTGISWSTVFYDDLSGSRSPFGSNVRSKKLEKIKRSVDEGSEKAEALDYAQWVEDWPLSPACKAIDAETLEKIVTYYAQDYACFGYPIPTLDALPCS